MEGKMRRLVDTTLQKHACMHASSRARRKRSQISMPPCSPARHQNMRSRAQARDQACSYPSSAPGTI
eukprot:4896890-Pleurochrysis_carterae.AAC.1